MRKIRIIPDGSCKRCGSLKHDLEEHNRRMAEGRKSSPIWKARMLEGNARKRGKPLTFSDPEARGLAISRALTRPETQAKIVKARKEMWANRSNEERQAIAEKSSKTQKGRGLSAEHLANLRKSNGGPKSEQHRKNLSAALMGREVWNKGLTKFTNASVMSNSLKQMGRIPDYNKYRAHYDGPKGKYLMRSRWEVAYAEWLDEQNIDWQYEPRWFALGGSSYTPDFYLPAEDRYVEIKGRMTEENAKKLKKFAERYPQINLTVLQRAELTAIGLLDKHCRLVERIA